MRAAIVLILASLSSTFTSSVFAQDKSQVVRPSAIKWSPCDPKNSSDPCQANYFLGNPEKEPNHSYFRVPKGHSFPPHWHTGNGHLIVIKGVFVVGAENDPKGTPLRPGEYIYEPAKWVHWGKCEQEDCIAYYYVDGPDSYIDVKDKRP